MKLLSAFLILFLSFGLNAQTKKIDTEKSTILWEGKKITSKHNGTLDFKKGALVFKNQKLKGGNFTVDMTTISATDVTGKAKEGLEAHLKDDDFFGVEKHPNSELVFKKIADKGSDLYTVTADLTIKNITKSITFDIQVSGNTASAKLSIDRTQFDVKYASKSIFGDLGDKAINDEFEIEVKLVF